jgi:ATP-dependent helicase/nuclease subunit B
MGLTAVKAASSYHRISYARIWLNARGLAEQVLIIGSTLSGATEITRSLVREKRAAFGYHRLSWGQFASTLARPSLTVQRTVPLGGP